MGAIQLESAENSTLMDWKQINEYYLQSREGYRVSIQYNPEPIYTAWTDLRPRRTIIKVCKTADEAKAECELHQMREKK